jgi:putative ABC transport system permease protein
MTGNSLKLALRVLARRKVFTAISLTGIVLTLLVLMVVTAVIENLFAATPPESRRDRILLVTRVRQLGPDSTMQTNPGLGFLRQTVRNLPGAELVSISTEPANVVIYDRQRRLEATLKRTDADFWRIFDFHFIEGAPYGDADVAASRPVMVISERLRDKLFGAGVRALGRTVVINETSYRVTGVVTPVSIAHARGPWAEMWTPAPAPTSDELRALHGTLVAVVLARSEKDIRPMQREFASRVRRVPVEDPKVYKEVKSSLDTPFEDIVRNIGPGETAQRSPAAAGVVLFVVAVLFMTLPALNLVTLNLSRILERAPEIGVRKAFGAPRGALIGQFVMENIVLTLIGGVLSFVLTFIALRVLEGTALIPDGHFEVNLRVFLFGMLTAVFFGVFSGFYPAWRMARLDPVNALRGGSL